MWNPLCTGLNSISNEKYKWFAFAFIWWVRFEWMSECRQSYLEKTAVTIWIDFEIPGCSYMVMARGQIQLSYLNGMHAHTHINQTSWQGDRAAKIKKWKPSHECEKDGERTNENEPLRTHDNKWVQRVKNVHDTNQQTNRRRQRTALEEKKMGVSKNKSGHVASVRCFEWNANVLHFI